MVAATYGSQASVLLALTTQSTDWLRRVTPVPRLKITYNNGHQEIVTAERYRADGFWIIFENADKQEVHRLHERAVQSITRADLSDGNGRLEAAPGGA
jgi:hypothetical protein